MPDEEKTTPSPPETKEDVKAEAPPKAEPKEDGKAEAPKTEPKAELDPALVELMKESGAQAKAVSELVRGNSQLAAKLESANRELAQLKQAMLSESELKQWKAYKSLGKPDGLQEVLAERDQLKQELTQLKRTSVVREASDLLQWKPSVLSPILPSDVTVAIQTEKNQPVAVVTLPDGTSQPLKEYVEKNLADFLPALSKSAQPPVTVPRLNEGGNNNAPFNGLVQEFLANMNKAATKVKS